ncbi:MAG TPA: PEP-utilizing enzyme [Tahibacter sp.]|nr:PEP-utilizing enzyme [Tahibacter sp.]
MSVVVAATAAFQWRGKAGTLLALAPLLRHSEVPPGLVLPYAGWRACPDAWLQRLATDFAGAAVAVRSCGDDEDQTQGSQAGRYLSRLDVAVDDASALSAAIDAVFLSYGAPREDAVVFVQRMAEARLAAVAATHAVEDGADYYAFSLAAGARSDAVTRGDVAVDTVYLAHEAPMPAQPDLALLYRALRELRELCGPQPLEAELVLQQQRVLLLQVRPLLLRAPPRCSAARRRELLRRQRELLRPSPVCVGHRRVLALMPDWNAAELLGSHPRPLALSLFRHVIADAAWHRARALLGYRRLGAAGLLQPVAGRPYVDVRASANSLLPQAISASVAARLADAWQERLLRHPSLHDRYEFAVAQTCVDFDFAAQWRERHADVLTAAERDDYRARLAAITEHCLQPAMLAAGLARFAPHSSTSPPSRRQLFRAGLAFALVARLAFVHEALLRSAVVRGALVPERLLALQRSCRSVTRELLSGSASPDRFGFLRAGTFEITTPALAELELPAAAAPEPSIPFVPEAAELRRLQQLLDEAGYAVDAAPLLQGYCRTREAREYAKYRLSALVSHELDALAAAGMARGLDRATLSWLDLDTATHTATLPAREKAAVAAAAHAADAALRLPVVFDPRASLQQVHIAAGTPSFVGLTRAAAPVVRVDAQTVPAALPTQAIVAVASADPGYDWIFARRPAGLITAYGGPNSHMAIRCAELGVPAVLGLGWERWQRLAQAGHLAIDPQTLAITPWTTARTT